MANYDPGSIVVQFNGVEILGFADGTFVMAERTEDAFTKSVGAGGDVTRVRSRDRSGTVTVTLQAESPVNDLLTAIQLQDELTGLGTGEVMVKDLIGTTLVMGADAWIRKIPAVEYSKDAGTREWIIDVGTLEIFVGSALF